MNHRQLLLCAVLIGCLPSLAHSKLPAHEVKALDKGEVLSKVVEVKGHDVPAIEGKIAINTPPHIVWEVVSNCDRYGERLHKVRAARLLEKKGGEFLCEVEVELPFPLSNLKAVTRARHEASEGRYARVWSLVRGDYRFNEGSWHLSAFEGDPKRTLVLYRVHADPTVSIPAALRRKAQSRAVPDLLERVRKESEKLAR